MHPDLIVFDCDGVLVDSEVLSIGALVSVLNEGGIPATYPMIARYFGMKQADIMLKVSEDTGHDIPMELSARIWPAIRARFEAELKPMPGLADFLRRHPDVPRCVASSSGPDRIRNSLRLTGLAPFFGENIFSSSQVARGKPEPDLFLFAAATMGFEPARCVVIEDSRFGVTGAIAAGMRAIGFAGGSHIEPHHAEALAEAGALYVERDWEGVERRLFGG
jgi:HAD superfamily hydrolase (TIGR01509 family)